MACIITVHHNRIAWLEVSGTKYRCRNVVVLEVDELPTFGIITDIVSSSAQHYLICEVLFTICFSHHFQAYEVCSTDEYRVCCQNESADHYVLSKYRVDGKDFVPLKYHLINNE